MKSPLGCAFLVVANESGLTPREIADPVISFHMGAYAARDVEVWRADRHRILPDALRRGPRYTDLARALLEEPATAWWFAPLDRDQQAWFPVAAFHLWEDVRKYLQLRDYRQVRTILEEVAPDPSRMGTPQNPPSGHERYAQRVLGAFCTSTLMQETSSLFVAFDQGVGDIGIGGRSPPFFPFWRLKAAASARVYEVNGPLAWHDLCLRYPTEGRDYPNEPDFSGDKGRVVPNWWAVSADWDAIHLSFGGWVTVEQVRIESPSGWTYHWGWDAEQTMWLRWMFTDMERMPEHQRMASPLEGLVHWHYSYRNLEPKG